MSGNGLSVGVIGLGYWGPNRLRALTEIDQTEVQWICDLDPARLAAHAVRLPACQATADFTEMLADRSLDAVVISTPVFSHHALALRALEAGKHVFVEKPLAASSTEAAELIEASERSGKVLMCGHTFLYSPPVRLIKDLLDAGELGELFFISSSRVNLGPYRSDVSVVFDLGPHDFSILRYWLGCQPESVSAVGRAVITDGVADVAFVDLTFPGGLLAHVELSWLAPSKLRRSVIVGSKKMLVYEDGSPEPVRVFDSGIDYRDPSSYGEYQLSYRTGDIVSLRVEAAEPIVRELEDFVRAISDESPSVSDGAVALDVIQTVEAAEASMANAGNAVRLGSSAGAGVR